MSCESSASQPREPGSRSGRDACTALSARPLHPLELHHNSTTAVLLPPFIHSSTTTPPHATTAPTATAQGPTARAGRAVDEWRQQQGRRRAESRHWRYARSLRRRAQLVIMARPGSTEHARCSARPSWLAATPSPWGDKQAAEAARAFLTRQVLWPGAHLAARLMDDHSDSVRGRTVLALGAGTTPPQSLAPALPQPQTQPLAPALPYP